MQTNTIASSYATYKCVYKPFPHCSCTFKAGDGSQQPLKLRSATQAADLAAMQHQSASVCWQKPHGHPYNDRIQQCRTSLVELNILLYTGTPVCIQTVGQPL